MWDDNGAYVPSCLGTAFGIVSAVIGLVVALAVIL